VIDIQPQTIRSASGEELVVLTRAEFDALVKAATEHMEDLDDVAIFDERMTELKGDAGARLPAEVAAMMLKGDTLLRALRKWKGYTQNDVAGKTNLAQGYISDLENGHKTGTLETLQLIAHALDIDPKWLGA
jgi:DNA-binding XRE family transcriptional regulator